MPLVSSAWGASAAIGLLAALVAAFGVAVAQDRDPLALAQDFRETMHHYATIERADGKLYESYVNDLALETWLAERRLPPGTVFAIESFDAARNADGTVLASETGGFVRGPSDRDVHVSIKRDDWPDDGTLTTAGLLFGASTDADGSWRMVGFDPDTGATTSGLDIADCHECYLDRRAEDFILSRGLLDRFARTGEPASISFECPEREICFGTP